MIIQILKFEQIRIFYYHFIQKVFICDMQGIEKLENHKAAIYFLIVFLL